MGGVLSPVALALLWCGYYSLFHIEKRYYVYLS